MSALPPKVDIDPREGECPLCANSDLAHCSKKGSLFDHLVGAGKQRSGHFEAQRLCGLEINDQSVLGRRLHRKVSRLFGL
jgi:hypothetical protein